MHLVKESLRKMKRFCQINQIFDDNKIVIICNYSSNEDLNKLNTGKHDLYILDLNISSLSSHIDNLKFLLSLLTAKVDILCISGSRISQKNLATINLDILGYNIEHTPTESSAGGTLMYISKDISYVLRDLRICSPRELESMFIEITIPNKPSSLLSTIYKDTSMKPYKFNNEFLEPLLPKVKAEGKIIFLDRDFNFNLIKYNQNKGIAVVLEHLFSNNFIPQITLSKRSTSSSQTLIDNIFINNQAFCSVNEAFSYQAFKELYETNKGKSFYRNFKKFNEKYFN